MSRLVIWIEANLDISKPKLVSFIQPTSFPQIAGSSRGSKQGTLPPDRLDTQQKPPWLPHTATLFTGIKDLGKGKQNSCEGRGTVPECQHSSVKRLTEKNPRSERSQVVKPLRTTQVNGKVICHPGRKVVWSNSQVCANAALAAEGDL